MQGSILEAEMRHAKREEVQVSGTRQVDRLDMEGNAEREKPSCETD